MAAAERATLDSVFYLRRLSTPQKTRFVELSRLFLERVPVRGILKLEPTDQERAWIASSCALLFVNRPEWPFPPVKDVVISPHKFDARTLKPHPQGTYNGYYAGDYGVSTVWLSREALAFSFEKDDDAYHVPIHEFAHALDVNEGNFDGVPTFLPKIYDTCWMPALKKAREAARYTHPAIGTYASTHDRETFAVAMEAFYERPLQLRQHEPELYRMLTELLKQDPAEFDDRSFRLRRTMALNLAAQAALEMCLFQRRKNSVTRSGKLIWQKTRSGPRRRVVFANSDGELCEPMPVLVDDLDAELLDISSGEAEVDLDVEQGRPRRVRRKGRPAKLWPDESQRAVEQMLRQYPQAPADECTSALRRVQITWQR